MRTMEEILRGEDPEEFMLRCSLDFGFFVTRVLKKDYQKFHEDWFKAFHYKKRSAILAPRGHGKTYILGVAYALWYCMFNERKNFVIISRTKEQSIDILTQIRAEIYDNELLAKLQPENKHATWTKTEMTTTTMCRILSKPYTDTIRGIHADRVLTDEVGFYEDKEIFYFTVMPIVNARDGHLMAISTPQSEGDLIMELIAKWGEISKMDPLYFTKKYSAIMDGKPLWEENFNMEKLEKIKIEQGKLKFNREYLCEPLQPGAPIFPIETVNRAVDITLALSHFPTAEDAGKEFYMGVDFGLAETYEAGWTVITIVEKYHPPKKKNEKGEWVVDKEKSKYPEDTLVVRHITRTKGEPITVVEERIKDLYRQWNVTQIWIDQSTFGENYYTKLLEAQLPVMGVQFTRENRMMVLMTLMKDFETNMIKIPYNKDDDQTTYLCDQLVKELTAMEAGETKVNRQLTFKTSAMFDDMVMSLALASHGCRFNMAGLETW